MEKVGDALKVGDEVEVKLLDVDFDRKRISLSMKALLDAPDEAQPHMGEDEVVASASEEETTVDPDLQAEIEAAVVEEAAAASVALDEGLEAGEEEAAEEEAAPEAE